jgi:hypothetical protein
MREAAKFEAQGEFGVDAVWKSVSFRQTCMKSPTA